MENLDFPDLFLQMWEWSFSFLLESRETEEGKLKSRLLVASDFIALYSDSLEEGKAWNKTRVDMWKHCLLFYWVQSYLRALIVVIVSEMSLKKALKGYREWKIHFSSILNPFLSLISCFLVRQYLSGEFKEWRICSALFKSKLQHCRIESRKDQSLSLKEEWELRDKIRLVSLIRVIQTINNC
jgi:hypothetical protein